MTTGVLVYPIDVPRINEEITKELRDSGKLEDNEVAEATDHEGIIRHDDNIYWLDEEGVIACTPVSDDLPIRLDFFKHTDKGEGKTTFCVISQWGANFGPEKIEDYLKDDAVPLESYVRRFGARLEGNFWGVVDFMRDIGAISEEEE